MTETLCYGAIYLLIFLVFPVLCGSDSLIDAHTEVDGYCQKTDEGESCGNKDAEINLTRLEGGEIGSTQTIKVNGEVEFHLKSLSKKPLILEVPNFLNSVECQHLIELAKKVGLKKSITEQTGREKIKTFQLMDRDLDSRINISEMFETLQNGFDIYLEEEDLKEMYKELGMDPNGDNIVSQEEIQAVRPVQLQQYLYKLVSEHPEKHSRYSQQAWLYPNKHSDDNIFRQVQVRVSELAGLPLNLVHLSDVQVVSYGVKGHYNAHWDSSEKGHDAPCCETGKPNQGMCKSCRYMTILFYLNDVEEGGETAFPVADNETLNIQDITASRIGHLYKTCRDANLRVTAEKGKAVLWYNHFVDPGTGWMGDMDFYTLHGGCPVFKGEKWIANFWIKTTYSREHDLQRMARLHDI
ncbi:hypothetical protein CHS0354_009650 [Potamilus streckersoni]|uniref:Fe2OG dioxygenase domain-containing protein n=1 Tax=Potamilus streckersoni TaxID=2493646 RepID=A0AAE0S416_9BIVA|nr:hypothetical protein CHS0354_009650 [Potamilus streckersoni]